MKGEVYPSYFRHTDGTIVAITAPDKMFIIYPKGRNTNPGVTLDHFITRSQVRKHYGWGERITAEQFKQWFEKIYNKYLEYILSQN